ncbi:MAG TPA: molybdopterin-dependent oxidoreductase, partial [Anaerolineales bacterium]|nr:molybdopterin-dependent oxidoreductase [Anaerolineales bacterium]
CTLPVSNGMVVNTETEALKKSRKFILSMLFSERNHFCPFCQVSGGDCELQNAAYAEEMTHWPIQPGWNNFVVDTSHPYFVLDNNRCILCRRCVRACAEMAGNFTLSVAERGAKSMVVADTDIPLGESTCIKCGSCVQVCPTGAIIDKTSVYQMHDKDLTEVKSICTGCSVGCSITLLVRDNRIVRIEGDWDGNVNHGVLCEHGRYDPVNESRKRINTPLMQKDGKLEPVSWNEALKAVADQLRPLSGQKDGIAAIISTKLPAETLTAFKDLFAGNELVTTMEEGMPTASVTKFAEKQGSFEGKLNVLRTADTVLSLGANVGRTHMVAGFMFKRNMPRGTRLINISPEENELDELANLSLKPKAGSDLALILGLEAIIVKEGLGRSPLALPNTEFLIQKAVDETGLSLEQLTQTARVLANSITPVILFGKGITGQRDDCLVEELYKLAVLIGAVDGERLGLLSLKGEANSLTATLLGLDQIFELNGHKAVYVAVGDDYVSRSLIERVSKAPYLVVQASYESELTAQADVVLPVTLWSEQEGHYINLDGRVQKTTKVLSLPENVRDNLAVVNELATRMNISLESDWKQAIQARKSSVALNLN